MAATLDGRYITVGQVGYLPATVKQSQDAFIYQFDYEDWLGGDDTVTSATAAVLPITGDEPTVGAPTVTGGLVVKVLVSAGASGYKGSITVRAQTSGGQFKEQELFIQITDK